MLNLKERGFQLEPSLQHSLANPSTFPRREFEELVRAQRAERHARGFTCWGQFIAMLFCQVSIPRAEPGTPGKLGIRWIAKMRRAGTKDFRLG